MYQPRFLLLLLAPIVCATGGCGGTSAVNPSSARAPVSSNHATATLQITVPKSTAASATARKPAYVSPATQSIAIVFTPSSGGSTQTFNENLTPATNQNCVASLVSPEICTVTLLLAPGAYTATFATYDGLLDGGNNPTGSVLSQNQSVPVTIVAGQTNGINVTLLGVAAAVAFIPGTSSTLSQTAASAFTLSKCFTAQSVTVIGVDADGNYIVGPGAPAPALTSTDPTQIGVTNPVPSAPDTFGLIRPGIPNAGGSATLTASVTPPGGSPTSMPITVTFDSSICGVFTEFTVPTMNTYPWDVALGQDGAIWFTENGTANIGRVSANGVVTEYAVPTGSPVLRDLTSGPDGAVWFTETDGNKIGRITTSGAITEYALPSPNSFPQHITAGPDGAVWFTEEFGHIGRISDVGSITEFATPTTNTSLEGIAAGSDGALWFAEPALNRIGRITTSGAITEYAVPTADADPYGIAPGSDGALWFTELASNKIGRITTNGSFIEYAVPTSSSFPAKIVKGPDGALWFTENTGNNIGRITTNGSITEYAVPTPNSSAFGITQGSAGDLWFAENGVNKIARLQ